MRAEKPRDAPGLQAFARTGRRQSGGRSCGRGSSAIQKIPFSAHKGATFDHVGPERDAQRAYVLGVT